MRKALLAALALSALIGGCGPMAPDGPATPPVAVEAEVLRPVESGDISPTLRRVRARGRLNCGVNPDLPGFAQRDEDGAWRGFDVDLCRAVAAAVIGDAKAVNFRPLDARSRFAALQSGAVDLLARNTAWTFSRDAALGVEFAGISYYDGQGLLVPRRLEARNAMALDGRRICVAAGTTSQLTLADYFRGRMLRYTPVPGEDENDAREAYQRGDCDALTGDLSTLASARLMLARPDDNVILPDVISKEPLGPVVREDDDDWAGIVRWSLYSMILAEELGLSSASVEEARDNSAEPEIRRLLGAEGALGRLLGLRDDWAYRIVVQVGSYAEVFERNLGSGSPLKLERGGNALWNAEEPGLIYAPPMR
jgi:general L-amino acid transport system substrate-binding protein